MVRRPPCCGNAHQGHRGNDEYGAGDDEGDRETLSQVIDGTGGDDWPHYQFSRDFMTTMPIKSTAQAMQVFREEFDAAWEFGGLWIAVWHPFLSGRLARAAAIKKLIEYMHEKGDVWFAPLEDIAQHVQGLRERGEWQPRVDRLPYYDGPIPELGDATPGLVVP